MQTSISTYLHWGHISEVGWTKMYFFHLLVTTDWFVATPKWQISVPLPVSFIIPSAFFYFMQSMVGRFPPIHRYDASCTTLQHFSCFNPLGNPETLL